MRWRYPRLAARGEEVISVTTPPLDADPQVHFAALRQWVAENCATGHPVREAAYRMALSHLAHCLIKYGPDERFNNLTSRDLMNLLSFTNGLTAEYLMRTAYFRSIIEGDHAVYEHFNTTYFLSECRAWYWKLCEALMARAPDPQEVTTWLENMQDEEKSVARLIIARIYPDLAHISWLDDLPETTTAPGAKLASQLCHILAQKTEYQPALERFLREHPHVRYA
jgi:hypothetical protein